MTTPPPTPPLPPEMEDEPPAADGPSPAETPPERGAAPPAEPESSPAPPPPAAQPPAEAQSPPSRRARVRAFLRKLLSWILGLFLVFAAGYLLAFFSLYQPLTKRYRGLERQAADARAQAESLQAEIDTLNGRIADLQSSLETLSAERDALQGQVDGATLRFYTLRALADVQGARLALTSDDAETAQVYLAKAPAYLEAMQPLASADVQAALTSMQKRLTLALDELTREPKTSAADLAILADWLRQFETTLR